MTWSKASPGRYKRSLLVGAKIICMHVLLAIAIIYGIAFVVVWAYI
jgi:hypothetical protein